MNEAGENALTGRFLGSAGPVRALRAVHDEGTFRGGVPLLSRPAFLTRREHDVLARDVQDLHTLLLELPDRLFGGDVEKHAAAVGMSPVESAVIAEGVSLPCSSLGRADLFRDDSGFRVLEFNCGSNLGGWDVGSLLERALQDPALKGFADRHGLQHDDPRQAMLAELLAGCDRPDPVVAVLCSPGSRWPGDQAFPHLIAWLETLGVDAVSGHLGDVGERADGLYFKETRIDIVYRMFGAADVRSNPGMAAAMPILHRNAQFGRVKLHTPLTSELAGSKACLALLSDESNHGAYEPAQREVVERMVPWTRVVRDGPTLTLDGRAELRRFMRARQRDLVLKPVLGFGGAGIVTGWTASSEEWESAVARAFSTPHIVQERVRPVVERFADFDAPDSYEDVALNWGAFCVGGRYVGSVLRGSALEEASVINRKFGAKYGGVLYERT